MNSADRPNSDSEPFEDDHLDDGSVGRQNSSEAAPTGEGVEYQQFLELVAKAREGSDEAFAELIGNCRDYLLLIANEEFDRDLHRKFGPSDIVQNSILAAYQNLDRFEGKSEYQFKAWLRAILLNDMRNARRNFKQTEKRQTNRETPIHGDSKAGKPSVQLPMQDLTPSTRAVQDEESRLLEEAMKRLPEEYRLVIELKDFQELSVSETAKKMDRTPGAVQKLHMRAVEKLAKELKSMRAL